MDFGLIMTQFLEAIGNPSKLISKNLTCIVPIDNEEDVKRFGYNLSFYGLMVLFGCLILIIILEICVYICKS